MLPAVLALLATAVALVVLRTAAHRAETASRLVGTAPAAPVRTATERLGDAVDTLGRDVDAQRHR